MLHKAVVQQNLVNGGEVTLQDGQAAAIDIHRQMPANKVLEIVRDWIA